MHVVCNNLFFSPFFSLVSSSFLSKKNGRPYIFFSREQITFFLDFLPDYFCFSFYLTVRLDGRSIDQTIRSNRLFRFLFPALSL